jgi:hypothetical protein
MLFMYQERRSGAVGWSRPNMAMVRYRVIKGVYRRKTMLVFSPSMLHDAGKAMLDWAEQLSRPKVVAAAREFKQLPRLDGLEIPEGRYVTDRIAQTSYSSASIGAVSVDDAIASLFDIPESA